MMSRAAGVETLYDAIRNEFFIFNKPPKANMSDKVDIDPDFVQVLEQYRGPPSLEKLTVQPIAVGPKGGPYVYGVTGQCAQGKHELSMHDVRPWSVLIQSCLTDLRNLCKSICNDNLGVITAYTKDPILNVILHYNHVCQRLNDRSQELAERAKVASLAWEAHQTGCREALYHSLQRLLNYVYKCVLLNERFRYAPNLEKIIETLPTNTDPLSGQEVLKTSIVTGSAFLLTYLWNLYSFLDPIIQLHVHNYVGFFRSLECQPHTEFISSARFNQMQDFCFQDILENKTEEDKKEKFMFPKSLGELVTIPDSHFRFYAKWFDQLKLFEKKRNQWLKEEPTKQVSDISEDVVQTSDQV